MAQDKWITHLDMLPAGMRATIRRYIEEGYGDSLGSFHRAVLSNDLIDALALADATNRAALPAIARYLSSCAPPDSFGSREKVSAWRGLSGPGTGSWPERVSAAEQAYADHAFDPECEMLEAGAWSMAERASHPSRTLMREIRIRWKEREYWRIFSVVFHDGQSTIEDVSYGDMLP